ncbi:MAG TPA: trehalase family glycosidase, partial [Candidatus Acidoferrum sp.]|nr:trehalase family glycosidase [Candidatus Acidoferrum sp.]
MGRFWWPQESPDQLLGEMFQDVQLRSIYPDSITFVDLVPASKLRKIFKLYERQRLQHGFNLHKFVKEHFRDYLKSPDNYKTNPNHTIEQHINELWSVLTHENYSDHGSLIALPHPYIVPGGRYLTYFYWDSYFTMLGLLASKRYDLLEYTIKNFTFLIRR